MRLSRAKIDIVMARNAFTIARLASEYGVSSQRMRMILGSKQVAPITAGRLAKALGCDVTEIIEQ